MTYYFDHTATKMIREEVITRYKQELLESNYNPASKHGLGLTSRQKLNQATQKIAELLDCQPEEVLFTSGATESINYAIKSCALRLPRRQRYFVSSQAEHSATRESLRFVREHLAQVVDELPLTDGSLSLVCLRERFAKGRVDLLSTVWVNNEQGALNDLDSIAAIRAEYCPSCLIHIDGVQALGKVPFSFAKTPAELMSFSLHKVGAPKGIGLTLQRQGVVLPPLIHGGGQQASKRSGTENVPLVLAAVLALEIALAEQVQLEQHCERLRQLFLTSLRQEGVEFQLLSPVKAVPHILALAFPALRGESLLTALSARGFAISQGSACSAKNAKKPNSFQAMGLSTATAQHSVRISFGLANSSQDVLDLACAIATIIASYGIKT